ncbi:MAG: dTDP-4-dehydrorhamnose 3,5-epimerase [Alphaproteobacteria bacterium]
MRIETTDIAGAKLLSPTMHADARGSFVEIWNRQRADAAGIADDMLQDNLVTSRYRGTLRGLHFQRPPSAQAKLVQVLHGAIVDFAVDIRHGSPSFGRSISVRLEAGDGRQLYVPIGCAHGYCTLEDDTTVLYKVGGAYYAPDCEMGIDVDDPALRLDLPFAADELIRNERDRQFPPLSELPEVFRWDGG